MKSVCAPAVAVTPARQLVSRTFAPARGRERAVFYGGKHKTGRSSCHVEKYGGSLVHHMEIRSISARRVILPANDARFAVGDPEIITGRGVILRAEKKTQASLTRRRGAGRGGGGRKKKTADDYYHCRTFQTVRDAREVSLSAVCRANLINESRSSTVPNSIDSRDQGRTRKVARGL